MDQRRINSTQDPSWRLRLGGTLPTLAAALLFSSLVACCLRLAWNPGVASYLEYVPIGGVFAAFLWERAFSSGSGHARLASLDVVVVVLALMRVFVPPLPYVSGHTLFATYAGLTARGWGLRGISFVVLAQVIYVKLFVSGGMGSMLGGLAVAMLLATLRASNFRARP